MGFLLFMVLARSRAVDINSSLGTMRLARPSAIASSADMKSPVSMNS